MKSLRALLALGMTLTALACPAAIAPASTNEVPGFTQATLATGKLFVPTNWLPRSNHADLLVFFHGHPSVVCSNLIWSGKTVPVVVVNYSGLSAAYVGPFRDTNRFGAMLREARSKLNERTGHPLETGRLAVASFSAGFGAVREILRQPEYFSQITDLVLADTLYAGYATNDGRRIAAPSQVEDFVRFARRAVAGDALMVLTHSQLVPGGYASTVDTADAILEALDLKRTPASGTDATGMALLSTATKGGFTLRSYDGTTGPEHMNHLRRAGLALRATSLPGSPEP
jgi:hypothetical protein